MQNLKRTGALALAILVALASGACAGQSASPTPIVLSNPTSATQGVVVVTKAKATLDNTATPIPITDTPAAPSDTPQAAVTLGVETDAPRPTEGPQITASGPTLEPKVSNSQSYNKAAPASSGPFRRVDKLSSTDKNGSSLVYSTAEGAQYQVALWITDSAQEALDRYKLETAALPDKRPIKLGDEGVITGPSSYVLAEVRYRNMVLVVYRPNPNSGTIPARQPTENEVIALVTALFNSIPKS